MVETVNYFGYSAERGFVSRHESSYNMLYHLIEFYPQNIYFFPEE